MDIRETVERLVKASEDINERREALNAELRKHEEYINSLHLGIDVGVKLQNNLVIGYGRLGKGWGLWYRPSTNLPYVESIFEAPLLARLAMHLHMHYLVKALIKDHNDQHTCATLDEAITAAKDTLEENPSRQSVIIVQIVRIVRRKNIPVEIQVVR